MWAPSGTCWVGQPLEPLPRDLSSCWAPRAAGEAAPALPRSHPHRRSPPSGPGRGWGGMAGRPRREEADKIGPQGNPTQGRGRWSDDWSHKPKGAWATKSWLDRKTPEPPGPTLVADLRLAQPRQGAGPAVGSWLTVPESGCWAPPVYNPRPLSLGLCSTAGGSWPRRVTKTSTKHWPA